MKPDLEITCVCAVACTVLLARLALEWPQINFYLRRWLRRLRLRCFFGFCEFAVTHRGGMYLIKAALIPVHLFELFQNFRGFLFHKIANAPVSGGRKKLKE